MNAKSKDEESESRYCYEECQRFDLWVYLLVIAILCFSTATMLWAEQTGEGNPIWVVVYVMALYLFLFDALELRAYIDANGIHVQLGHPIPIFWKRIAINSIRDARVVSYRPLLDAGGWGLRFGRFDGMFTIYWNARGNRGVFVETETRRYVIGSQDPEALHVAIERARAIDT